MTAPSQVKFAYHMRKNLPGSKKLNQDELSFLNNLIKVGGSEHKDILGGHNRSQKARNKREKLHRVLSFQLQARCDYN
jgi:hypothetical protein